MIMIFSAFTIYENTSTSSVANNTQPSIPIQSYNAYGESVSFIGNQPVISFSSNPMSTHYPVSWDIMSVNTGGIHNTNSATPLVSTNNTPLSLNQFTHYRTSRINDTTQNSAQLIQCSNTTQSASVFFFHHYTMSASLAWKNKHPYNQTYMIDFTMITPYCNSYYVGGDNGFHNMTMINNAGIIPASCVNLQVGGIDLYWMSDASLFHGGMIEQKDHHDVVVIPFGTVTLQSNETYTIDPSIEPAPLTKNGGITCTGGGSGGGSGSSPTTTYPPTFSYLTINDSYKSCIQNGSLNKVSCDTFTFCYEVSSETQCSEIQLMFCEIQKDGHIIILSDNTFASQFEPGIKSFTVNNIGCFCGFAVAYYNRDTDHWVRQKTLGHSFNEYINLGRGYGYPNSAIGSTGYDMKDNGNVVAVITGEIQPGNSYLKDESPVSIHLLEGIYSKYGCYVPESRSWSLSFVKESNSTKTQCAEFSGTECYSQSNVGQLKEAISIGISIAAIILGIAADDPPATYLGVTSLALSLTGISSGNGVSYSVDTVCCPEQCAGVQITSGRDGEMRYAGFNGTINPDFSFGQSVNTKVEACFKNETSHIAYDLSIFQFTESFSVFNKSSDGYTVSPCTYVPLYSSTMTSPVYLQTCYAS